MEEVETQALQFYKTKLVPCQELSDYIEVTGKTMPIFFLIAKLAYLCDHIMHMRGHLVPRLSRLTFLNL